MESFASPSAWFLRRNIPHPQEPLQKGLGKAAFVRTLKDRYIRKVPLPQAPRIQHTSHVTRVSYNIPLT